jgi:hypothetical protein
MLDWRGNLSAYITCVQTKASARLENCEEIALKCTAENATLDFV